MRSILFATAFLLSLCCVAQESANVFEKVEIEASTNRKALHQHISSHTILPDSIKSQVPEGRYRAVIQFIVDKHGYTGQFIILNDPGHGLGARALKIMKSYTGTWQPASQCGRVVAAYKKQEIVFVVEGN